MAADWIKWEKGLDLKPEIHQMAKVLSLDSRIVPTLCMKVWEWADTNCYKCNAPGVTSALLDRVSGVDGFGKAMISVGWLSETGDGIEFPNFERHNGQTAKARALTAKRVCGHRYKCNDDTVTNVTETALPEKRREEKREDNTGTSPETIKTNGMSVFEKFWDFWPSSSRKAAKAKCETHWNANNLDEVKVEIQRSLTAWKKSAEWAEKDGQFIPAPIVWLRARKWEAADPTPAEPVAAEWDPKTNPDY